MKYLGTALLGAAGILALSVIGASAAIVCNEDGDCWHVKQSYDYPPDVRVHVYGDDWKWVMPMPTDIGGASTRDAATGAAAFGSVSNGEMRLLRLETEQPSFRGSKAASPRLFSFATHVRRSILQRK